MPENAQPEHWCGRRAEGGAAVHAFPGPDEWKTDRWNANVEEQEKLNAAAQAADDAKYGVGKSSRSSTADMWLWPGPVPRTCSYCGGIHPDDALRLINEGWEFEGTGKGYKGYLNPPGTKQAHATLMNNMRPGHPNEGIAPSVWSPVPPVKIYVQDWNDEQIRAFNERVKRARTA